MLSDLLRSPLAKCGGDPLGFYLDSSTECNRLAAQRLSMSLSLPSIFNSHPHPLRTLLRLCVRAQPCQGCNRVLYLKHPQRGDEARGERIICTNLKISEAVSLFPAQTFLGTCWQTLTTNFSFSSLLPQNIRMSVYMTGCPYYLGTTEVAPSVHLLTGWNKLYNSSHFFLIPLVGLENSTFMLCIYKACPKETIKDYLKLWYVTLR